MINDTCVLILLYMNIDITKNVYFYTCFNTKSIF